MNADLNLYTIADLTNEEKEGFFNDLFEEETSYEDPTVDDDGDLGWLENLLSSNEE
ncbi:hypothetical protein [Gloeothece verrucosa]|uniref:Uncharacterized protein n=1 Tax=Gloeothece verrucosa (strain PCC 7822) TaxID=497965 RepID=E0ULY2_GLOV7|nr:hypothetical protein [Gloeothece verrucosa]ADN17962.1 hypothetical protein Cyan7822_6129 [Gloeothece verrucosa PCC 7822]